MKGEVRIRERKEGNEAGDKKSMLSILPYPIYLAMCDFGVWFSVGGVGRGGESKISQQETLPLK